MKTAALGAGVLLVLTLHAFAQPDTAWRTFEGSWSAVGRQETLPTEGRVSSILRLSGSVVLRDATGFSRGFQAEAIGFDDGSEVRVGRAVWTNERGERIYSEFRGDPIETGRKVSGRISGGTGRYRNASGDYELTWQYVVRSEEGSVQGRSADLKGRIRVGPGQP